MKKTGILLHISSLPSQFSIGSFGKPAYDFVDLLANLGFNLWQVLPLCPTDEANSPYNSPAPSGFNPLFMDLEILYNKGIITKEELNSQKKTNTSAIDYSFQKERIALIKKAFSRSHLSINEELRTQWLALKKYANSKNIEIIGDIPFYCARHSNVVKNNPQFFNLETQGGAPPDYFNSDGQAWSAPTYNWQSKDIFEWWARRLFGELNRYDYLRIDHFRGLVDYWEIPKDCENGKNGKWKEAKPYEWFAHVQKKVDISKLLAEDLGTWSQGLEDFVNFTKIPNMKVLQFGFDGNPNNPHLPQNYPENCVAYTGTHDNNTLIGFCEETFPERKSEGLAKEFLQDIFASKADKVLIQMQDLLFLGAEYRMNTPGKLGSWTFRLSDDYAEHIDYPFFKELIKNDKKNLQEHRALFA